MEVCREPSPHPQSRLASEVVLRELGRDPHVLSDQQFPIVVTGMAPVGGMGVAAETAAALAGDIVSDIELGLKETEVGTIEGLEQRRGVESKTAEGMTQNAGMMA